MTDRGSQPRRTPLAGHWTGKVATSRWCHRCERLHRTRRHSKGEEACPKLTMDEFQARANERGTTPLQPYVHKGLGPKRVKPFAGMTPP